MKYNNNFTNINVKYLREKNNIQQSKLAKDLGIDQSTLAKWENNTRQITLDWAIKLANYFDISIGDFISVNQMNPEKSLSDNYINSKDSTDYYKNVLKEKGLMDENENIDEESLNKLIKIADILDGAKNKED